MLSIRSFLFCLLSTLLLLQAGPQVDLRGGEAAAMAQTRVAQMGIPQARNVTVELIAEVEAVVPGEPFRLALRQTIREGWHTYWSNPGDSGAAMKLSWKLPEGVDVGPIQWPLPKAIPYFDLMNHGYEGEVVLLNELRLPADWPVGEPLHIDVTADWLVCADICIPESAELALSLRSDAGPPMIHPINGMVFEEAEKALPRPSPWATGFNLKDGRVVLGLEGNFEASRIEQVHFFASDSGTIAHAAAQELSIGEHGLVLNMQIDDGVPSLEKLEGLLVITENPGDGAITQGFEISARKDSGLAASSMAPAGLGSETMIGIGASLEMTLWQAAFFAFIGGLILNLMPCVFPILSMKALSLVRHAGEPGAVMQGLVYAAGVLVSFLLLAGVLMALKAGGSAIGWGFQLQSPVVIALLAYLMAAVGLWLSGAVELPGSAGGALMSFGSGLASQGGTIGSFFTGVLAVLVATPCTAPFMAPALGFALVQDAGTGLVVFASLGFGFALPFLLLSASPGLQRLLPRPGLWMARLKELLAFPMYATAAWLVWVLSQQVGPNGLLAVLMGLVMLGLGVWLLRFTRPLSRVFAAFALIAALGLAFLPITVSVQTTQAAGQTSGQAIAQTGVRTSALVDENSPAEPFSKARLEDLLAEGRPVLVNMTAAWCITCLVNERVALASDDFIDALETKKIAYLKGDWTNGDPEITAFLASFGRSGVPIYVVYPGAGLEPVVLPQILTESMVMEAFAGIG